MRVRNGDINNSRCAQEGCAVTLRTKKLMAIAAWHLSAVLKQKVESVEANAHSLDNSPPP